MVYIIPDVPCPHCAEKDKQLAEAQERIKRIIEAADDLDRFATVFSHNIPYSNLRHEIDKGRIYHITPDREGEK